MTFHMLTIAVMAAGTTIMLAGAPGDPAAADEGDLKMSGRRSGRWTAAPARRAREVPLAAGCSRTADCLSITVFVRGSGGGGTRAECGQAARAAGVGWGDRKKAGWGGGDVHCEYLQGARGW